MSSGPLVIGPRTATAGTVLSYSVPKETQAIYVQNYSKLTLLVSFAATAPTATDSLNNDYDGVLAPGGRDTFYVQSRGASSAERSLNAMGAFTGNVWIMPVDRTSAQRNTGAISTASDIWLSAYGPYDPPPPFPGGMPLNVDLSSQPRVITVPISLGVGNVFTGRVATPGAGAGVNLATISNVSSLTATNASVLLYIYHALISPGYNVAGAGGMDASVMVDVQTAANVSIGFPWPDEVIRFSFGWAGTGAIAPLAWPPAPFVGVYVIPLPTGKNIDHIAVTFVNQGSTNAPPQFDFTLGAALDLSSYNTSGTQNIVGPIGSGALPANKVV